VPFQGRIRVTRRRPPCKSATPMVQRSSVTFWLLVAATIFADLAAIAWLAGGRRAWVPCAVNLCSALTLGQLSVIAVWLVFRPRHDLWSWIIPIGALFPASMVRARLGIFGGFTTADYALRSALQMLVSIFILWILVRTAIWCRLSVDSASTKLEYSMRQLLFWMTATAVLLTFVARCTWRQPYRSESLLRRA
jgi:hypothetical protein